MAFRNGNTAERCVAELLAVSGDEPEAFYRAMEVVKPDKAFIVAPIKGHYP